MRDFGLCSAALLAIALAASGQESSEARTRRLLQLLGSGDATTRASAAQELAECGPAGASGLVRALGDKDPVVRERAREALSAIGPGATDAVITGLKSKSSEVRWGCAVILGDYDRIRPVVTTAQRAQRLLEVLEREPGVHRYSLHPILCKAGSVALDLALKLAARTQNADVADELSTLLGGFGALAHAPLGTRLRDGGALERTIAARALARSGAAPGGAVPLLRLALEDPEAPVRRWSAEALGRCTIPVEALAEMARLFGDPSVEVREAAAGAVANFGKASFPVLEEELKSPERVRREAVRAALLAMRDRVSAGLLAGLSGASAEARRLIAQVLADVRFSIFEASHTDALAGLLRDASPEVRRTALLSLRRAEPSLARRHGPALAAALADEAREVRLAALESIASLELEPLPMRSALAAPLGSSDALERLLAAFAAWRYGLPEEASLLTILPVLKSAGVPEGVRAAAARLLGQCGPRGSAFLLELGQIAQAEDQPEAVRLPTIEAIGNLLASSGGALRGRPRRWQAQKPELREAVEAGLAYLAQSQSCDGAGSAIGWWDGDGPEGSRYRVGRTGLVLLAFLARGPAETGGGDPHEAVIARGLAFLRHQIPEVRQRAEEPWSKPVLEYAVGVAALAEAWAVRGRPEDDRGLRGAAIDLCLMRNPYLAWRYTPRDGENDTHVTAWVLSALRTCDLGGVVVDPDAYEGARSWLTRAVDPKTGHGSYRGTYAPRSLPESVLSPEFLRESSAALQLADLLMPVVTLSPDLRAKGWSRLASAWPMAERADYHEWAWSSAVLAQSDARAHSVWRGMLERVLLGEMRIATGPEAGSWPPCDAWSREGGRAYATAMAILALLGEVRYERGTLAGRGCPPDLTFAMGTLETLSKSVREPVAEAARLALERARGGSLARASK